MTIAMFSAFNSEVQCTCLWCLMILCKYCISGIAEHLDIRCLLTRLSLAHEIAAFKDDKVGEENFFSEGSSETEGNLEHPVIIFDPTNPGRPVFKTAIMENFRYFF